MTRAESAAPYLIIRSTGLHVYQQATRANNWPFAVAASVIFMVAVLVVVGGLQRLGRAPAA